MVTYNQVKKTECLKGSLHNAFCQIHNDVVVDRPLVFSVFTNPKLLNLAEECFCFASTLGASHFSKDAHAPPPERSLAQWDISVLRSVTCRDVHF